jgi:hypothetical protein
MSTKVLVEEASHTLHAVAMTESSRTESQLGGWKSDTWEAGPIAIGASWSDSAWAASPFKQRYLARVAFVRHPTPRVLTPPSQMADLLADGITLMLRINTA